MRRLWIVTLLSLVTATVPAHAAGPAKPPKTTQPPAAASLLAGVELFMIDTPHSEIGFTVPWMGISRVHGTFQDFVGTIAYDEQDPTRSHVMLVIHVKSIDTNFERRDKDLKGPDFFDVEKYPSITFASRAIERRGDGFVVSGPLSMHGVTREVQIPLQFNGRVHDRSGDPRIGFEGRVTLKRKDFGIVGPPNMNALLEKGIVIGEDVEIPIAVEGWRAMGRDTMRDRTADSLYRAVLARGVPAVAKQFQAERGRMPDSLMAVDEGTINAVGYQLIEKGRAAEAVGLFRLEVETWPANPFGYTGLGQAYATLGDRERAIPALENAITIQPEALRAQVILRRLKG